MADVTNELLYEVLKAIQRDLDLVRETGTQTRAELIAMRGHLTAIQQDIHNLYAAGARHDERLERIERRLDLADAH